MSLCLVLFYFYFQNRVSLCDSLDCPGTHILELELIRSTCLSLQNAGIKDVRHHSWMCVVYCLKRPELLQCMRRARLLILMSEQGNHGSNSKFLCPGQRFNSQASVFPSPSCLKEPVLTVAVFLGKCQIYSVPFFPSLSSSTLSMSSGSSLGSLTSSRGSLNTSSRGSLNSLSSSELYYTSQGDSMDADYQCKLDFLLQEKGGYIPSGPITTIHENEVVKSPSQPGQSGLCGVAAAAPSHTPPLTEASKSVTSLSSRSSLSSLSPPGSPLVLDSTFPVSPHDTSLHQFTVDFEDCGLSSHFADIGLGENQVLLDSDSGASQSLLEDKDLDECTGQLLYEGTTGKCRSLLPSSHFRKD